MKKDFKIDGMSCHHCVMAVQKNLAKLKLKKYEVRIGSANIEFDEAETKEEMILKAIDDAGYKVVN
ncbi:MAG: cation transporter [Ignavibacteriaceae bacterium]